MMVIVTRIRGCSRLLKVVILAFFLGGHDVSAANIDVSLDRNPVPVSEAFTITFTADDIPDGSPDFTPLSINYEVLSQGQSKQFSLNNGQASRKMIWQVSVIAKKPGKLEIPVISFGKDHSNPFIVNVTYGAVQGKQGGDANIFLEVEANPKNPYVQAQVLYTVRVLTRVPFSGELGQPEVEGALVEKLDDDREYVDERDGVQFKVDERKYAVFPQKSGRLTIQPVNLTAQVASVSGTIFNPTFQPSSKPQRFHSEPVNLNVRPIPPQFTGKQWLPATKLDLTGQWSSSSMSVAVGDPISRTINLVSEGTTLGVLPELVRDDLLSKEVRQYPDQGVPKEQKLNSGFVSSRQQKTAFIGSSPGEYHLASIEIPWWNTKTDKMEYARLPEQTFTVMPQVAGGGSKPEKNVPPSEAHDKDDSQDSDLALKITKPNFLSSPWLVRSAIIIGLVLILTVVAFKLLRRRGSLKEGLHTKAVFSGGKKDATLAGLEKACLMNDPIQARRLLLLWFSAKEPGLKLSEIDDFFNGNLRVELDKLNRAIFAFTPEQWQGVFFWTSFADYLAERDSRLTDSKEKPLELESLYKG